MPEMMTKYPEVAIRILKNAGFECGADVKQQILTQCPKERFCATKTGEICIYDVQGIASMTQVSTAEIYNQVSHVPTMYDWPNAVLLGIIFILGMIIGRRGRRVKRTSEKD